MKKLFGLILCLLLASLCAVALADVELNSTNFPDETFRFLLEDYDEDEDDILSNEEISTITSIMAHEYGIASLKGVEYLTSLQYLDIQNNKVTKLDLSQNAALSTLNCSENRLSKLDISRNTALTSLSCFDNRLTALDVSNNTELLELDCQGNRLTSIDISRNTKLYRLLCSSNKLTTLDISKNTELRNLYCGGNKLTVLDISRNTKLESLSCEQTRLNSVDISNCPTLRQYVQNNSRKTNTQSKYDYWTGRDADNDLYVDRTTTVYTDNTVSAPTVQPTVAYAAGGKYKLNSKKTAATLTAVDSKNYTTLVIPDSVTIGQTSYPVTSIAAGACKGMKKLTTLTIGAYIKTIGKEAFSQCKKVKVITIRGALLKKVGEKAFSGIPKKAVVSCPAEKIKAYKKLLRKGGLHKKVKFQALQY